MSQTLVFDFNGTMIFDTELQYVAWQEILEESFNRQMTASEFQTHVAGRNNRHTFDFFADEPLRDEDIRALSEQKEVRYRQICLKRPDKFCLVPGLASFLDRAVVANRHLNIATASESENVAFFFAHLGLGKWFDSQLVVGNDGSLPGKPAPDMFLKAIANVGGMPNTSAIFEDSPSGIQAANRGQVAQTFLVVDPEFGEPQFNDTVNITQKITSYEDVQL